MERLPLAFLNGWKKFEGCTKKTCNPKSKCCSCVSWVRSVLSLWQSHPCHKATANFHGDPDPWALPNGTPSPDACHRSHESPKVAFALAPVLASNAPSKLGEIIFTFYILLTCDCNRWIVSAFFLSQKLAPFRWMHLLDWICWPTKATSPFCCPSNTTNKLLAAPLNSISHNAQHRVAIPSDWGAGFHANDEPGLHKRCVMAARPRLEISMHVWKNLVHVYLQTPKS